jgi:hypothetical protein
VKRALPWHVAVLLGVAACAGERSTTAPAASFIPGQSYRGRNGYVEYLAGNAPVIVTAPHGGTMTPSTIPDRTASACGGSATIVTDANTQELARAVQQKFFARFGGYPHVVIMHLSRRKLDANRTATEAACGNAIALDALTDWHTFIENAKTTVLRASGKGWYIDLHGHGHPIQRLELGYLLLASDLDRSDTELDATASAEDRSSIRSLSVFSTSSFSAALRGPNSFGTLFETNGFRAVPSASDPTIAGTDYFNGGDNTLRHSCSNGAGALGGSSFGQICGVQLEANFTGVRDNAASRDRFGTALAAVLEQYLRTHWGLDLAVRAP